MFHHMNHPEENTPRKASTLVTYGSHRTVRAYADGTDRVIGLACCARALNRSTWLRFAQPARV